MIVTFISQCEKKSLNKTRRVLDAFANRIGNRTWQTPITEEGLQAVKKLLKKTATKNTAVACHKIKTRKLTKLEWIVGNRDKFNFEGHVPVNFTNQEDVIKMDEGKWNSITVIKYASAIAGLFHDFGKANILFQNKIDINYKPKKGETVKNYEPYRHEWVSLRLFQAFVGEKNDNEWLIALSDVDKQNFPQCFQDGVDGHVKKNHPLNNLPPFAKLVAWLILTHHRLPLSPTWKEESSAKLDHVDEWLNEEFGAIWNSYNCKDTEIKNLISKNWEFKGLPIESMQWRSEACLLSSDARIKLQQWISVDINWLDEQLFATHLSRLCLTMADHYYSAQDNVTQKWRNPNYHVFANTYRKNHPKAREHKQKLDEHLIGVAHHSAAIAKALPKLNYTLDSLKNNKSEFENKVEPKYKDNFGWQDEAKKLAKNISKNSIVNGFFGINMASTGKGKTLGNAKIMYALAKDTGRRRFNVAIGLRSLTLQTGREFQKMLDLSDDELAIAVGGSSVKQLFEYEQRKNNKEKSNSEETGSESALDYIDSNQNVYFKGEYKEHSLRTWTKKANEEGNNNKLENLIQAPVLVCTIDHLMPACEGTKGGKQIPPMLRLLTSDLVLDEPDDFGLDDLPALCRLVHWAAMLGSRVLLSTATMPPNLAYALFQAYKNGWSHYAKANIDNWNGDINCAWFDEFKDSCTHKNLNSFDSFVKEHKKFIKNRVKQLNTKDKKQKLGKIINVIKKDNQTYSECFAQTIQQNILQLHKNHQQSNEEKSISIGLVRMANINPLVAVAKEMLKLDVTEKDTCIHYCIYHSRYPLAVRSHLESKLDRILNRKNPNEIWQNDDIKKTLKQHKQSNHIFVVIASPVAEVGRDHDYDWAIIEPSSIRSIIQIAGRVLRHRDDKKPTAENILILNKNYKATKQNNNNPCFEKPGFEMTDFRMENYDLNEILQADQYQNINAIQRITMLENITPNTNGKYDNLVDLEHSALKETLFANKGSAKMWWKNHPHWCGEMQRQQRFRKSQKDDGYYLFLDDEDSEVYWQQLNEDVYPSEFGELCTISIDKENTMMLGNNNHFWFDLSANEIYTTLKNDPKIAVDNFEQISKKFGEVRIVEYEGKAITQYTYHENLGLYRNIGEENGR